MKCCACETELPHDAKFCNVCGEKLELDCPECKKPNPVGSKFCLACGQQLAAEKPTEIPVVADAERKQVTALFSDLSGYTPMTERLDPEEVKEITGRFHDGVKTIVGKYDGFIEKFAGDGVLALFGVPKAHEDDPVRAVRAAREIHDLVEGMNPAYEARIGAHLSMHSGIHTGLAVTADVDSEKGTHGMSGATISIAARLSGIAKAGEILLGPVTQQQVERQFVSQALGHHGPYASLTVCYADKQRHGRDVIPRTFIPEENISDDRPVSMSKNNPHTACN
jgi:class 3 adenylate cyclase